MKHTEGCWSLRVTYPLEKIREIILSVFYFCHNHMTNIQAACKENILGGRPTLHCRQMEQTVSINNL